MTAVGALALPLYQGANVGLRRLADSLPSWGVFALSGARRPSPRPARRWHGGISPASVITSLLSSFVPVAMRRFNV